MLMNMFFFSNFDGKIESIIMFFCFVSCKVLFAFLFSFIWYSTGEQGIGRYVSFLRCCFMIWALYKLKFMPHLVGGPFDTGKAFVYEVSRKWKNMCVDQTREQKASSVSYLNRMVKDYFLGSLLMWLKALRSWILASLHVYVCATGVWNLISMRGDRLSFWFFYQMSHKNGCGSMVPDDID